MNKTFGIIVLSIISVFAQVNAECCTYNNVQLNTLKICWDGAVLEQNASFYCAHGKCNAFGCDCVGGCRLNWKRTDAEAIRLYKAFEISQLGLDNVVNGSDIIRT